MRYDVPEDKQGERVAKMTEQQQARQAKHEEMHNKLIPAIEALADRDELTREYPEIEDEDIRQCLEYAACNLDDKLIEVSAD